MRRPLVCFFLLAVAFAQSQELTPYGIRAAGGDAATIDPVTAAIQAVWQSRRDGAPPDATLRDQARAALAQAPIASPQYGEWAETIAQFYSKPVDSRAVLEEALARLEPLGKSSPARIVLLNALSDSWRGDRNLLKALAYAEQAAEASPRQTSPGASGGARVYLSGTFSRVGVVNARAPFFSYTNAYYRLADLYHALGRPQDAAALAAKLAASGANDSFVASLYERNGQLDEAEKVFQKMVDEASTPQQSLGALQSLSGFYQRQRRYDDAIAALQQAITASTQQSPGVPGQAIWLRQSLARLYREAGRTADADGVYQQILSESQSMPGNLHTAMLTDYAGYLGSSNRDSQAAAVLNGLLDGGANLQPWEQSNAWNMLAGLAQKAGNPDGAAQDRAKAAKAMAAANAQPLAGPPGIAIAKTLDDAAGAAGEGRYEDALTLTLRAIGEASSAIDRSSLVQGASNIAMQMAHRAPDEAQQIFDRLFPVVASWEEGQPLENLYENYARMLMNERRWTEASEAIERDRDTLLADRGAGTGWLEQYYRLKIEAARERNAKEEAGTIAEEFLKFEVTLSGDTSQPYLSALGLAAPTLEAAGATERALALYRRSVTVVDLTTPAGDYGRAATRSTAALALARAGQFDEARQLACKAVAISPAFAAQLQQIRKMAAAGGDPAGGEKAGKGLSGCGGL